MNNNFRDHPQQQMSVAMSPRPGSIGGPPQMPNQQAQLPPQVHSVPGIGMGRGGSSTGLPQSGLSVIMENPNHLGIGSQQANADETDYEGHLELLLNSYIYEHLLKSGFYKAAKGLLSETNLQLVDGASRDGGPSSNQDIEGAVQSSNLPRGRATALKRSHSALDHSNSSPNDKINGKSPTSGPSSPRTDHPDLPPPKLPLNPPGEKGFLRGWWVVFWDIFSARSNQNASPSAYAYLETQVYHPTSRSC